MLDGKKVPVYAEGKNVRDWIYVDDHNRGVDLIINKGRIGDTYCLGANNELTNIELTRKVLQSMNISNEMIEYVADRPGHDFRYAMDASKIQTELGWAPEMNFEQGLAETIKWYQENEEWWRKLKK